MLTVSCPTLITSPAPDERSLALGLKPNMVCGMACHVYAGNIGQIAEFRCPVGHRFFAPIPTEGTQDAGDR